MKKIERVLSGEAGDILTLLGHNIKLARKRRKWRQVDLAARVFTTPPTIRKLERGEPGVSLGIFVQAMCILGFGEQLLEIGDPLRDKLAIDHYEVVEPTRIRVKKSSDNMDF